MIKTVLGASRYNNKMSKLYKMAMAAKLAQAVKEKSDDPELLELAESYFKA